MKFIKAGCFIFGFVLLFASSISAQETVSNASPDGTIPKTKPKKNTRFVPAEKAHPIQIPRFQTAPVIDGKMNDEVWRTAAIFKDFLQTQPGGKTELFGLKAFHF